VAIADAKASMVTLSISVITHLLANGPEHQLDAEVSRVFTPLNALPVDLPAQSWPAILSENDEEFCPRPT
jgi:hypothetical protein